MAEHLNSACPILKPSRPEAPDRCWEPTCRAQLPKRARKWCAEHKNGATPWWLNHRWQDARSEAIRRACDLDHKHHPHAIASEFLADDLFYCQPKCSMCGVRFVTPEVDHIIPWGTIGGRRSEFSCLNHQENLRVLCHDCHSLRTAQQRRGEKLDRENAKDKAWFKGQPIQRTFFAWDPAAFISGKQTKP